MKKVVNNKLRMQLEKQMMRARNTTNLTLADAAVIDARVEKHLNTTLQIKKALFAANNLTEEEV